MTFYISPYRRLTAMRHAMDRMFEDNMAETAPAEREMLLAVDVKTGDEAYDITALVPGLEADNLDIAILNNTVTIRGEFKDGTQDDQKYLACELPSGRFSRVITLPTVLDPARAEASIHNGVLHLSVPKAESHRPKTIKITAE